MAVSSRSAGQQERGTVRYWQGKGKKQSLMRILSVFLPLLLLALMVEAGAAQIVRLPLPADTTSGNAYGAAVAIDGTRVLVGASGEPACGVNSGAAYVYEYDTVADRWEEVARLTPASCEEGAFFGHAVALSGDRALIGTAGARFNPAVSNFVYVFERDTTGIWTQTSVLAADSRYREGAFGASVALDGGRALVTTTGDRFEGRYSGAAYVFERNDNGIWRQSARLVGSGSPKYGVFGGSGEIDGDRLVVAASTYVQERPGSVYIFERDGEGRWREKTRVGDIEDFFISVAINGDRVLVGESKKGRRDSGAATLIERQPDGTWARTAELQPRTPYEHGAFGSTVALRGDVALVAGYDEQLGYQFNIDRVVYVFVFDPEAKKWKQRRVIDVGEVAFGTALALAGEFALIGQASAAEPGAAYVVRIW